MVDLMVDTYCELVPVDSLRRNSLKARRATVRLRDGTPEWLSPAPAIRDGQITLSTPLQLICVRVPLRWGCSGS